MLISTLWSVLHRDHHQQFVSYLLHGRVLTITIVVIHTNGEYVSLHHNNNNLIQILTWKTEKILLSSIHSYSNAIRLICSQGRIVNYVFSTFHDTQFHSHGTSLLHCTHLTVTSQEVSPGGVFAILLLLLLGPMRKLHFSRLHCRPSPSPGGVA